jgi:hypothetical protein
MGIKAIIGGIGGGIGGYFLGELVGGPIAQSIYLPQL